MRENWPIVTADDDGIRPAGPPDECFYCQKKVGSYHNRKCVTVKKRVRYNVLFKNVVVGTFDRDDPHFWTEYDCNFHKNESSWCADNALDEIQWKDPSIFERIQAAANVSDEDCYCGVLSFEFLEVIDPGPFQRPDK